MLSRPITGRKAYYGAGFGLRLCVLSGGRIMSRIEEVELTNMCMICDGKGNVLVQDKRNNPNWSGWNFPGGHVEKGEYCHK